MLNELRVHGFRTLVNTTVSFAPLTIMLGKNGVGKSTVLDVVQVCGKFARGGPERAFGPPPWSLGWQRTKGIGTITTTDFELRVTTAEGQDYVYSLKLGERANFPEVKEERLIREADRTNIAAFNHNSPPKSGTILRPDKKGWITDAEKQADAEIQAVSSIITSFESYELNPAFIERGNDPKTSHISRNGAGVAGYLANLIDNDPDRFTKLMTYFRKFRPETEEIRVWGGSDEVFWGLLDKGQKFPFPAVHLSWGDRQLVGLLCVLFSAPPGGTIAIEEIDRGFHASRYGQIIELVTETAYEGIVEGGKTQIIVTTHSPSFVNKLTDYTDNIRLVTRAHGGATVVRPLKEVLRTKLGATEVGAQPLGEVWEMGLLEETLSETLV